MTGLGSVPAEAIILQLCELFHCRPSELDDEDGLQLLRLMDLRAWRDKALDYDNDPRTTSVSSVDKTRFTFIAYGDNDALFLDAKELTMKRLKEVRARGDFKLSKAKKEQIKDDAVKALGEFRGKDG